MDNYYIMESYYTFKNKTLSVTYCTSGKFQSEKTPVRHKRHNTDSFVLLYGISQTMYLSDFTNNYTLSPGSYVIFESNREGYCPEESPPGLSYYWVHFYINGNYTIEKDPLSREILVFGENGRFRIPLAGNVGNSAKIGNLFCQLSECASSSSQILRSMCGNFLEIILATLSHIFETPCESVNLLSREATVENVIKWIHLNAADISKVSDVADHFGYNSEYLTTLVKKTTDRSLIDHITESRVDIAKSLLVSSSLEISEIARKCGFSDEKYFFRIFKKYSGTTPSVYRKNHAAGSSEE